MTSEALMRFVKDGCSDRHIILVSKFKEKKKIRQ